MKKSRDNSLQYLEGKWISNQTIYDLKHKQINTYQFNTEILLLNNSKTNNFQYIYKYKNIQNENIIYNYIFQYNLYQKSGIIEKINKNKKTKYIFIHNSKNSFRIIYSQNNIIYIEYIYFLHQNFKLSVGIMKKSNKYKAIYFTSNIKIMHS
nr:hypothetical protein [Calliblepharis sp.]